MTTFIICQRCGKPMRPVFSDGTDVPTQGFCSCPPATGWGEDMLRHTSMLLDWRDAELADAQAARLMAEGELEQARRWSATLWRVVRAYRGYMAGLVRDTSLYMESDDEAWRRHMSDWSEIRRAEQAKQAGEAP